MRANDETRQDYRPAGTSLRTTAATCPEGSPGKAAHDRAAGFRRNSPTPKILILHRGIIHKDDADMLLGFRITRPLKTIADLPVTRTVSMDHMAQAVKQAFQRGIITPQQVAGAPRISDSVKGEIEKLRTGRYG
jgi:hypothetical protein